MSKQTNKPKLVNKPIPWAAYSNVALRHQMTPRLSLERTSQTGFLGHVRSHMFRKLQI
jgi:hypothetical protein